MRTAVICEREMFHLRLADHETNLLLILLLVRADVQSLWGVFSHS